MTGRPDGPREGVPTSLRSDEAAGVRDYGRGRFQVVEPTAAGLGPSRPVGRRPGVDGSGPREKPTPRHGGMRGDRIPFPSRWSLLTGTVDHLVRHVSLVVEQQEGVAPIGQAEGPGPDCDNIKGRSPQQLEGGGVDAHRHGPTRCYGRCPGERPSPLRIRQGPPRHVDGRLAHVQQDHVLPVPGAAGMDGIDYYILDLMMGRNRGKGGQGKHKGEKEKDVGSHDVTKGRGVFQGSAISIGFNRTRPFSEA